MDTVLAVVRTALLILTIWTAVSVIAVVPILAMFRAQARRDALRTREDRRRAWSAACRTVATR